MQIRSTAQRVSDAKRRLETDANVWIATASAEGDPHLVALSLCWDGSRVLTTTPASMPVAQNIAATGRARAALDSADNVVSIKASATSTPLGDLTAAEADSLTAALGWDPRGQSGEWVVLELTPELIWSWNSEPEGDDRTIMRGGIWLE